METKLCDWLARNAVSNLDRWRAFGRKKEDRGTSPLSQAIHDLWDRQKRVRVERMRAPDIDFSLDTENRLGLELYFEHAAKLGLIAKANAIHWAAAKSEAVKL